ncbi:hypothetical protein CYMTET_16101, partial [Cymbomonas tetramitiformis]
DARGTAARRRGRTGHGGEARETPLEGARTCSGGAEAKGLGERGWQAYGHGPEGLMNDPLLRGELREGNPAVEEFLRICAVCNTVVPAEREAEGSSEGNNFWASSPDEVAIVKATAQLGVTLVERSGSEVQLRVNGSVQRYEVLDVLEFTSERRCMSVIVRDLQTGRLSLYTKGADDVVLARLVQGDPMVDGAVNCLQVYAESGLRTLCVAMRRLDEGLYKEWSCKYAEARAAGVLAIEDRLQEAVPETVEMLQRAGIALWMLTGDKRSTALNIAKAAGILPSQSTLLHVQGGTEKEIELSLHDALAEAETQDTSNTPVVMVVEGSCLDAIVEEQPHLFSQVALLVDAVVCCRVTPSQKARISELACQCGQRVLAIGDGANDVAMIQEAHVGVGLSGCEGLQAARAADFSFAKFHCLQRLLLIHGRSAYQRTCFISQFCFYKSLLLSFTQILYAFSSAFSGSSLFSSFTIMAYNVVYTSFPVLGYLFNKDLQDSTVLANPHLYRLCQNDSALNDNTAQSWLSSALLHAIVLFSIATNSPEGLQVDQETQGITSASCIVWVQSLVLLIEGDSFTLLQHVFIWGSLAAFYTLNTVLHDMRAVGSSLLLRIAQPSYWLTLLVAVTLSTVPLLMGRAMRANFSGEDTLEAVQRGERENRRFMPTRSSSRSKETYRHVRMASGDEEAGGHPAPITAAVGLGMSPSSEGMRQLLGNRQGKSK